VASIAGRDKPSSAHSPYPLCSSSQTSLLLRSPLRTPWRKVHNNLVSGITDAATSMSGVENDPAAQIDSKKLDQLFGLVTTMNTRLDRQSQQVTTVESAIPLLAQACDVVLPTGSSGGSSGTATGTGAGDNRRRPRPGRWTGQCRHRTGTQWRRQHGPRMR
jgi:hypothetical protein